MDIHKLAVFVRVYETGSFTRAAHEGYVSRQAVGKAVSQLEEELGRLFERRPRGVRPTALADAVYPHARRAVDACTAIEGEVLRFARGHAGRLLVALESNAALTLPAGLTTAYARDRPDVGFRVHAVPGGAALDRLASGEADAAVAGPPSEDGPFAFEPVLSSTVTVVLRAPTRAVGDGEHHAELPLEALNGRRIFGVAPDNHVERQLVRYLADHGIDAAVVYDYADTMLATSEMEAGEGGVIVEGRAAEHRFADARYVHVPLRGPGAPDWRVGVSYRPDDACVPVARDFAAYARAYIERAGTEPAVGWQQ